jgi:hypothetical protein
MVAVEDLREEGEEGVEMEKREADVVEAEEVERDQPVVVVESVNEEEDGLAMMELDDIVIKNREVNT